MRRRPSGRIRWAQLRANSLRGRRLGGFAAQPAAGKTAPNGWPADRIPSAAWRASQCARRGVAARLPIEAAGRSGRKGFRSGIVAASFCKAIHPKLKGTGWAPWAAFWRAAGRCGCFSRPVSSTRASRRTCAGFGAPRPEDGAKRRAPKSLRTLFTRNRAARRARRDLNLTFNPPIQAGLNGATSPLRRVGGSVKRRVGGRNGGVERL